jgi:hypothetical protein
VSDPHHLEYQTPAPPPPKMSKVCCLAITWAVLTSPLITFFPVAAVVNQGGPVALFFARNMGLRYAIFMGLPVIGIFLGVKGVTDVQNNSKLDGRRLGIWAIWICVLSLIFGARIVEPV